jgi:tRNA pseudouridine55 synthase
MATGVLPLLLGKYTRLAQYFSSAEKTYTGAIRFGFSTDTYDAEGVADGPDLWPGLDPAPNLENVRAAAARFHGEMEQMPPPTPPKRLTEARLQAGPRGQAGGAEDGQGQHCQL